MSSTLIWLRNRIWQSFLSATGHSLWGIMGKLKSFKSFILNTGFVSRILQRLGYSSRSPYPLITFPKSGFEIVPDEETFEEEMHRHFAEGAYYPVHIGDVFKDGQYQVVGKLGFGVSSTVWLAKDLKSQCYVTLKIFARVAEAEWEIKVAKHISGGREEIVGYYHVRKALDNFEIPREGGNHHCIVQEALGSSLQDYNAVASLPEVMVQSSVEQVLQALVFLHFECCTIHTDIKADHIMQAVKDSSIFEEYEQLEFEVPAPRKFVDGKPIYMTRMLPMNNRWGMALLCDFGHAVWASEFKLNTHYIQPDPYRAPEVMLEVPWSYPVDIWNLAIMAWHMVQGETLFKGRGVDEAGDMYYSPMLHLAEIVGVLGPPPPALLEKSAVSGECFDKDGNWIVGQIEIKKRNLEDELTALEGESKEKFLEFLRKTLTWDPEERAGIVDLLSTDRWIREKSAPPLPSDSDSEQPSS